MRKILLILQFLTITLCLNAQVGFEQNVVIDETFGIATPKETVIVDLDNDGYKDIIVAGSGKLVWFKNLNGLGNYSKAISILSENYGFSNINSGDLNGDNIADLVYIQIISGNAHIMWSQNDGTGGFGAPQELFVLNNTFNLKLQIADIDGDTDNDIGFRNGGYVGWLDNENSSFAVKSFLGGNSNTGITYDDSILIDIDNDDRLDIIADLGDNLRAYKHEADGTVTFLETMSTFSLNNDYDGADIDDDGDNDIVAFFENGNTRQVHWYENTDGLGTFANRQTLFNLPMISTSTNTDNKGLQLVDLDNDDLVDILTYDSRLNGMSWYQNQGTATFGAEQIISDDVDLISSINVSDLDNDGVKDIVTTSFSTYDLSWFKGLNGLGVFSDEIRISSQASSVNHVDYGDIDGDGDLDLVSSSHADNRIAWYENINGEGDFSNIQQIISRNTEDARDAFVLDIDGDNDNDVLAFSFLDDTTDEYRLIWFENDGSGSFSQEQLIYGSIDNPIIQIDYADVDGDDDMDIMTAMPGNMLLIFKNNGNGTFATPQQITPTATSFAMREVQFEDVDGDDDIDILVMHDDQIVWYDNSTGTGDYTTIHIVSNFNGYEVSLDVADIDNDNDPDIIFSNKTPREIGYFKNIDGTATTYDPKVVVTTEPFNPWVIHALDIDNDGDQDIITNSETGQKFIWYPNDGMAGFGDAVEISSVIGRINHVISVDINNDGNIDLMTSSYDDDKVAWFENLGAFTNSISGVVRLDANADGCDVSDAVIPNLLIVANNGTNTFSTFTKADGTYNLKANQENFTTSISSALPNYYTSNPASYTYDFTGLSNTNNESDFCIEANQTVNDVSVVIYPNLNQPRPGFDTSYQLVYRNNGTVPLSGSVVFQYDDSKINVLSASETIDGQTSNMLTFNYSDLNPFEIRTINLECNVFAPPMTSIGDVLTTTATINPVGSDDLEDDNIFNLEQIVIGSYDPNDIRVLEGNQVHIDDINKYLHYIIRFQNTGTASAINVRVNTILDDKLDWSTLQLESLSHNGSVEITDGNNINFIFDDINLPDSTTDEPNSHGYITYKIKPKNDVIVGNVINAIADIYFDFNPPIITNIASTEIVDALSISDLNDTLFSVFPNPVNSRLNIKAKVIINSISIFDNNGRLLNIFNNREATQDIILDVYNLETGIYFLKIESDNQQQTLKFIKK